VALVCGATEIAEFCRFLEPTAEERDARTTATQRVSDVVTAIWPTGQVQVSTGRTPGHATARYAWSWAARVGCYTAIWPTGEVWVRTSMGQAKKLA